MLVDYFRIHYVCLRPRCTKEIKMRILCKDGHRIEDSEKQFFFCLKNIFVWNEMILNIYLNAYDVATQPVVQLRDCILNKMAWCWIFPTGIFRCTIRKKEEIYFWISTIHSKYIMSNNQYWLVDLISVITKSFE